MNRAAVRQPLRVSILVIVNVVVVVLLLEVSLRVLRPRHHGLRTLLHKATLQTSYQQVNSLPELLERSTIGYRPGEVVGGFVLNSRGLRTAEYDEHKDPDTYRVIALGDSFTFGGIPTAHHWTSNLERQLARCREDHVEVLRMGVPATGPPFQLRLWQVEGVHLSADLVVLGFFVGNDFFDEQGRLPGWRGWLEQLSTVSYTVLAARNLLRMQDYKPSPKPNAGAALPDSDQTPSGFELSDYAAQFENRKPPISRRRFLRIEAERMSLCLRDDEWKLAFRLDRVARFLEAMHAEVTATGARFVILVIPDEYQVNDALMRDVARFSGRSTGDYDLGAPQRELMTLCANRGIECLDLLPLFREKSRTQRLYLRRDTHWNRAGHKLAGRELGALLCGSRDTPEQQ